MPWFASTCLATRNWLGRFRTEEQARILDQALKPSHLLLDAPEHSSTSPSRSDIPRRDVSSMPPSATLTARTASGAPLMICRIWAAEVEALGRMQVCIGQFDSTTPCVFQF